MKKILLCSLSLLSFSVFAQEIKINLNPKEYFVYSNAQMKLNAECLKTSFKDLPTKLKNKDGFTLKEFMVDNKSPTIHKIITDKNSIIYVFNEVAYMKSVHLENNEILVSHGVYRGNKNNQIWNLWSYSFNSKNIQDCLNKTILNQNLSSTKPEESKNNLNIKKENKPLPLDKKTEPIKEEKVELPIVKKENKPLPLDKKIESIKEEKVDTPVVKKENKPLPLDKKTESIKEEKVELPIVKKEDKPLPLDKKTELIKEEKVDTPVVKKEDKPLPLDKKTEPIKEEKVDTPVVKKENKPLPLDKKTESIKEEKVDTPVVKKENKPLPLDKKTESIKEEKVDTPVVKKELEENTNQKNNKSINKEQEKTQKNKNQNMEIVKIENSSNIVADYNSTENKEKKKTTTTSNLTNKTKLPNNVKYCVLEETKKLVSEKYPNYEMAGFEKNQKFQDYMDDSIIKALELCAKKK